MANEIVYRTEDEVRDSAKIQLGFDKTEANVKQGTGQITTFNQLGFKGVMDKQAESIQKKLPKLKILSYMVLNLTERYLLLPVQICLFIKMEKPTWNTLTAEVKKLAIGLSRKI